jgi:hypothetical protein
VSGNTKPYSVFATDLNRREGSVGSFETVIILYSTPVSTLSIPICHACSSPLTYKLVAVSTPTVALLAKGTLIPSQKLASERKFLNPHVSK